MYVQVFNLTLDIFCKFKAVGSIPKDQNFVPLSSDEDLTSRTLLSLAIPEDSMGVDMHFAGSACVSIGFMQTIIELLTKPGDIVLDWAVGEGWSLYFGDYSGRHVIGLEDRTEFGDIATQAHMIVQDRHLVENAVEEEPTREVEVPDSAATTILEDDIYAILEDEDARLLNFLFSKLVRNFESL